MTERSAIRNLAELTEALTQSIGAAGGLIHMSGNPEAFMVIRDALLMTREGVMGIAAASSIVAPSERRRVLQ